MNERAAVPQGKSIFYRSAERSATESQTSEDVGSTRSETHEEINAALDAPSLRLALYDRLSESIQLALSNASQLLSLASQTRIAAEEMAETVLAEARAEQQRLLRENQDLTRELGELQRQISQTREEIKREEEHLRALLTKREALQAELEELERRRRQAVSTLQAQLATIGRLRDALIEHVGAQHAAPLQEQQAQNQSREDSSAEAGSLQSSFGSTG